MEVKFWDFKTNKVTEIKLSITEDNFSMSLMYLGNLGAGHSDSTSEEKTKKLKGREELELNQIRGLILGAPAV